MLFVSFPLAPFVTYDHTQYSLLTMPSIHVLSSSQISLQKTPYKSGIHKSDTRSINQEFIHWIADKSDSICLPDHFHLYWTLAVGIRSRFPPNQPSMLTHIVFWSVYAVSLPTGRTVWSDAFMPSLMLSLMKELRSN